MSDVADRYRRVARGFTERVDQIEGDAWESPSPCEGWVARDVVRHLVEWIPPFLAGGADVDIPAGPSVDDDPAGAWRTLDGAIQTILDDPATPSATFSHERAGTHALDRAIDMFVLGDVLIHTWDLARAAGLDDTLPADEVAGMLKGLEGLGDTLEKSGHYARRVDVSADADDQTKLLALTGRTG